MRLLAITLAVAVSAAALVCGGEPDTTVPQVVPRCVQDAITELREAELEPTFVEVPPIV